MKSFVEFRSSKFPPYNEEKEINHDLWGKRLAEYLVAELAKHGIETSDFLAEDWGYYIPIHDNSVRLALCCGHQYESEDIFIIFTDQRAGILTRLFGGAKKREAEARAAALMEAVGDILEKDPDITDVIWGER